MKACPSIDAALADVSKGGDQPQLQVLFPEGAAVSPPGVLLSSQATKSPPTISLAHSAIKQHPTGKYIAACIDLDAPFPSFSFLGPICHWLQIDLVPTGSESEGFTVLETQTPPNFVYAGPGPPPPSAAHRYVFLVWEQPEAVADRNAVLRKLGVPDAPGMTARMRWDQPAFESRLSLGKPVAVNFFTATSK